MDALPEASSRSTTARRGRIAGGIAAGLLAAAALGLTGGIASAQATAPGADAEPARAEALVRASNAVIGLDVHVVEGARSAETLGALRRGSGVVIGPDDLVLTIGYLILEADRIDLVLDDQRRVPATPVAYDLATGFGLVQALVPLPMPPAPLGQAAGVKDEEPLLFVSGGRGGQVSIAKLESRREFAGYWEYFIEGALFTAPARDDHSGAGLFNRDGELVGIGSLVVADAKGGGQRSPGNMFVPIDLLKPVFAELREQGRSSASSRAWLGLNCIEDSAGRLRVIRVGRDSPAEQAGIVAGDEIVAIDGQEVHQLAALWKALWRGGADRDVRLAVKRGDAVSEQRLRSVDRASNIRRARGI
jgi:S1-C subfamily serine protease